MKNLLTLSTLTCIATAAVVPGQAFAEASPALDRVGIGAEYGVSRIRYQREDGNAMARLNVRLDGPALFLRLRF
jgi:hypothetical protein